MEGDSKEGLHFSAGFIKEWGNDQLYFLRIIEMSVKERESLHPVTGAGEDTGEVLESSPGMKGGRGCPAVEKKVGFPHHLLAFPEDLQKVVIGCPFVLVQEKGLWCGETV